jgi:hypothetical protein
LDKQHYFELHCFKGWQKVLCDCVCFHWDKKYLRLLTRQVTKIPTAWFSTIPEGHF